MLSMLQAPAQQAAAAAEAPWQPLKWTGTGPPPLLVNPQQLQPPQTIPCCLPPLTARGRGRGGGGTAPLTVRRAAGVVRRTAAIAPSSSLMQDWQQQQQQQQQQSAQQFTTQGWQQQSYHQQTVQQNLQGPQWPPQQLLLTSQQQQQVGSPNPLEQQQQQQQQQPFVFIQGYGHGHAAYSPPGVVEGCASPGLHHSSGLSTNNSPLAGTLASSLHQLQLQPQVQVQSQVHSYLQQQQQQQQPAVITVQMQHQQGCHQPQGQLQQVPLGSAAHPVGGVLLGHMQPGNSLSALPASVAVPAQQGLVLTTAVHLQAQVQPSLQQQPQLQPVQLVLQQQQQQQQQSLPVHASSVLSDQLQLIPQVAEPGYFQAVQQETGGLQQVPCLEPSMVLLLQQQPPVAGEQPVHAVLQPDRQGLMLPVFQLQPQSGTQSGTVSAWMCNMPD